MLGFPVIFCVFCIILRSFSQHLTGGEVEVRQTGTASIELDFLVQGDGSLGPLQTLGKLTWWSQAFLFCKFTIHMITYMYI